MDKQPEALRLADVIDRLGLGDDIAVELRRLHEVNAKLVEALQVAKKAWGDFIPPANSNALKAWDMVNTAIAKATGDEP